MVEEGNYRAKFSDFEVNNIIKDFDPYSITDSVSHMNDAVYLMNFQVDREIKYSKLSAIPGDPLRPAYQIANQASLGITPDEIKGWFVNRCLYSKQEKGFTSAMRKNLSIAKEAFNILDKTTTFNYIDPHTNDIQNIHHP